MGKDVKKEKWGRENQQTDEKTQGMMMGADNLWREPERGKDKERDEEEEKTLQEMNESHSCIVGKREIVWRD